ncbi:MAG: hypothetical protein AAFX81_00925 [Pseudomonadota bacterium]
MTTLRATQTSFVAGELDPRLIGRTDLGAYGHGAAKLTNVLVTVGGSLRRRPGLAHVTAAPGPGRLVLTGLASGAQRLFLLTDRRALVYDDEVLIADVPAPWTGQHLPDLNATAYHGNLFVCHPALPPQQVVQQLHGYWAVLPWLFASAPGDDTDRDVRHQPYAKYADEDATLQAFPDASGNGVWVFQSDRPVFDPGHAGTRLRFKNLEVAITSVAADRTIVFGIPQQTIADGHRTYRWEEQAFSPVAGYPAAATVFRERLVVGGVPRQPNRLWMSRVGRLFDFDTGTGLDDEAIGIRLGDDRSHAIRSFGAGRELEVFTARAEWTVDGAPLSPASVSTTRQTGVGSFTRRYVPVVDVDGASVFVSAPGDSLVEYHFAGTTQAYQAADLTLRARHLLREPVDLAFDLHRRLLLVARADGRIAAATLDRNADVVAWSELTTAGHVHAVAAADGKTYVLVDRLGSVRLERLDDALFVDAGRTLVAASPTASWTGLSHLEGANAEVVADGLPVGALTVLGGSITTPAPATRIDLGLAYSHVVEPLPVVVDQRRKATRFRPIKVVFELNETRALDVDVGEGLLPVPLDGEPAAAFSGPKPVMARGWRQRGNGPAWRIETSRPLPFELLSVTSDVKVTR